MKSVVAVKCQPNREKQNQLKIKREDEYKNEQKQVQNTNKRY